MQPVSSPMPDSVSIMPHLFFPPAGEQLDYLEKGAAEIIRSADLRERLDSARKVGRPLAGQGGFRPHRSGSASRPHGADAQSSSTFRISGHQVIFLVGRLHLAHRRSHRPLRHAQAALERGDRGRTPRPTPIRSSRSSTGEKTEVRFNSEWLSNLGFEGIIRLAAEIHRLANARARRIPQALQERAANLATRNALSAGAGL